MSQEDDRTWKAVLASRAYLSRAVREARDGLRQAELGCSGLSVYLGTDRGFAAFQGHCPYGLSVAKTLALGRMFVVPLDEVPLLLACGEGPGGFWELFQGFWRAESNGYAWPGGVGLCRDVLAYRLEVGL